MLETNAYVDLFTLTFSSAGGDLIVSDFPGPVWVLLCCVVSLWSPYTHLAFLARGHMNVDEFHFQNKINWKTYVEMLKHFSAKITLQIPISNDVFKCIRSQVFCLGPQSPYFFL